MYRPLWGAGEDYPSIAAAARAAGFDGLEGGLPADAPAVDEFAAALAAHDLEWIAEVCTGGNDGAWWIPRRRASVDDHLRDLEAGFRRIRASRLEPRCVNCMGGLDAWPLAASVDFFGRALELAATAGFTVAFETHRSRSLFSPWATLAIVEALPALRLTCDFSHWCVVAERLIDEETEALAAVCPRALHVQCRVGYAQGPQVPHPAAPEYAAALAAHQRWWEQVWAAQRARGETVTTMTPEFGPDGYLQCAPFGGAPVADLWAVNRWMADTERAHFARWRAAAG
jgi:sugar phosphate isomerase/epimerase